MTTQLGGLSVAPGSPTTTPSVTSAVPPNGMPPTPGNQIDASATWYDIQVPVPVPVPGIRYRYLMCAPTRVTCGMWCSGGREGLNSRSHTVPVPGSRTIPGTMVADGDASI